MADQADTDTKDNLNVDKEEEIKSIETDNDTENENDTEIVVRSGSHLPNGLQHDEVFQKLDNEIEHKGNDPNIIVPVGTGAETDYETDVGGSNNPLPGLTQYMDDVGFDMSHIINAAYRTVRNAPPSLEPLPLKTKLFIYSVFLLFILSFVMVVILIIEMIANEEVTFTNLGSLIIFFFVSVIGIVLSYYYRSVWLSPPAFIQDRVESLRHFDFRGEKQKKRRVFGIGSLRNRKKKETNESRKQLEQTIERGLSVSVGENGIQTQDTLDEMDANNAGNDENNINDEKKEKDGNGNNSKVNSKKSKKKKRVRYGSLIEAFMEGDFLVQLYYCQIDELRTFLPIIAQTIASLPFGLTKYRNTLARVLSARIQNSRSLDQAWRFFLNASKDVAAIQHFWSDDDYFSDDIDNDPVEHFDKIYKYFCKNDNKKGETIKINSILRNKSYYLFDPISGYKIESVRLKTVMKSNAKPLLIDLIYKIKDRSNNMSQQAKMMANAKRRLSKHEVERGETRVLLKKGDDLRKDSGVTLMFHIMNAIWNKSNLKTSEGITIEAITYQCIPFTDNFGLIEFIPDCTPLREMHSIERIQEIMTEIVGSEKYQYIVQKSKQAAQNAANGDYIDPNVRRDKSRNDTVASRAEMVMQRSYDEMAENKKNWSNRLVATAAGSYIAAYVLGVRDRHSNNILINETDGTLFHIDFGYIMGETIKSGIDAPPFAITNDLYRFIAAKSALDWKRFVGYCVDAFELLRRHHMELLDYVNIAFSFLKDYEKMDPEKFLLEKLMINKRKSEAMEALKKELLLSPNDMRTPLKNISNRVSTALKK